jgi:hypothetical protein
MKTNLKNRWHYMGFNVVLYFVLIPSYTHHVLKKKKKKYLGHSLQFEDE